MGSPRTYLYKAAQLMACRTLQLVLSVTGLMVKHIGRVGEWRSGEWWWGQDGKVKDSG